MFVFYWNAGILPALLFNLSSLGGLKPYSI